MSPSAEAFPFLGDAASWRSDALVGRSRRYRGGNRREPARAHLGATWDSINHSLLIDPAGNLREEVGGAHVADRGKIKLSMKQVDQATGEDISKKDKPVEA